MTDSFVWTKNFETGQPKVDEQHQKLVKLINQFGHHVAENDLECDEFEHVFQELSDYADYHFRDEEEMMSRVGLDNRSLAPHIMSHHYYLDEVRSMHSALSPNNPGAAQYLLDFLTQWLVYHILGVDQNVAKQIVAIKSGLTPAEAYKKEEREADKATEPLLAALNGLFHQVSVRNKELVKLNASLDAKVKERTQALSYANHHLEVIASTDVLTGLPNRRYGMQRLSVLWQESQEANTPLVCIMVDADYFKEINDHHGHEAGDTVLRELARTLQHELRTDDIVFRLGGDEFLIICPNTSQEGGLYLAGNLRKKVSELRIRVGEGSWKGSISLGVAARTSELNNHEELLRLADKAVYTAKEDGRNCVRG
ncbi:bacteriohemerythrin [Myxococcota bacterium]|nr:bacteriohemerythrin [Myxococcota bacterium]